VNAFRITLMDGAEALALPGLGMCVPGRDQSGKVLIGTVALLTPGMPPMPLRHSLKDIEDLYNGKPKLVP
jgi:hypothetical protein